MNADVNTKELRHQHESKLTSDNDNVNNNVNNNVNDHEEDNEEKEKKEKAMCQHQ